MGEAKRKKLLAANNLPISVQHIDERVDIARLSGAMRKLARAASAHFGSDCFLHASLCREVLKMHGIEARITVGFSGWRIGAADHAVIVHRPVEEAPEHAGTAHYHAWLEAGDPTSDARIILDFTTYQLRLKAAELDRLDGQDTAVEWCPDYLAVTAAQISPLSVVRTQSTGLFYYERNKAMERKILSMGSPVEQDDVYSLLLAYKNPDVIVIGTNDEAGRR